MIGDAQVALESLAGALNERFSEKFRNTTAEIFEDLNLLQETLDKKKIDIVGLVAHEFIQLADSIPMIPFLVASQGENPYFEMVLLVRISDTVRDIAHLKGKNLIIDIINKEHLAKMWTDVLLLREGLPLRDTFFNQIKEVDRASLAILPVFFDQADACITSQRSFNTMVELNPQVGKSLRILCKSPNFLAGVVCVSDDLSDKDKKEMLEILEEIHTYPEGEQLLLILQIDKLVSYHPEYLETTEALVGEYSKLSLTRRLNQ